MDLKDFVVLCPRELVGKALEVYHAESAPSPVDTEGEEEEEREEKEEDQKIKGGSRKGSKPMSAANTESPKTANGGEESVTDGENEITLPEQEVPVKEVRTTSIANG